MISVSSLARAPVSAVRRLPAGATKDQVRAEMFKRYGTPRGHPRLQVPRKQLLISPGDTVVQVGTPNIERVEQYASLTQPNGQALIVEPNEENYQRLVDVAVTTPNVAIDQRAVGPTTGTIELPVATDVPGGARLDDIEAPETPYELDTTQETEMAPLDVVVEDYDINPDYVEIMINGAEAEALRGATHVLESSEPRLLLKAWGAGMTPTPHVDDVVDILQRHDYNVTFAPIRDTVPNEGSPDGDIFAWK